MSASLSRSRALALLASAPLAGVPVRARAQTATIRLGTSPADSYGEPFYAIAKGFFKQAGIDVSLTLIPAASAIAEAVAGNALDVGLADPIQVAHPVNAGVSLAFFAGGGLYRSDAPATLLVAAKTGPVNRAKDLEGGNVAVISLASISSLATREWLRQNGADVTKVKFIEMPFSTMVPALGRGTIAAAFLAEPFLSDARNDVRVIGKAFDAIAKSFYISSWFAPRDWIAKNTGVARRLVQVAYQTARWANANQGESAPIIAEYTKIPLDRVRSMTRTQYATSLDVRNMQPVLDIAYRYQQLERPVNANTLIARI
ncbi:MAG TPA: ABC transporter substrate-binding protein [Candidatus Acidoferrales bacterium]|nr:ABC transporter substrate-binding protein [Candidatus Acidoferrales bacterium]